MKRLFTFTALIEIATGVALLASPGLVVLALLGSTPDAPAALVVARLTGAALLSMGVACWVMRNEGNSRAGRGLVTALLVYNAAAVIVVAEARFGSGLRGPGLWPVVLVHTAMAGWCLSALQGDELVRSREEMGRRTKE